MVLPDIAGYTVSDAEEILKKAGFTIHSIKVTKPPGEKTDRHRDDYRVLRVNQIDDKVVLLVAKPLC